MSHCFCQVAPHFCLVAPCACQGILNSSQVLSCSSQGAPCSNHVIPSSSQVAPCSSQAGPCPIVATSPNVTNFNEWASEVQDPQDLIVIEHPAAATPSVYQVGGAASAGSVRCQLWILRDTGLEGQVVYSKQCALYKFTHICTVFSCTWS
jgi:hypothetical protein